MKLLAFAQRLAEASNWSVTFNPDGCIHSIDRFAECEACVDVCPAGGISAGKPPILDEAACQDCRACLAACPTGAFSYNGIDAAEALFQEARHLGAVNLELFCQYHTGVENGASGAEVGLRVMGCLAGLGPETLLRLLSLGVRRIIVRSDSCADCRWSAHGPRLAEQIAQAKALLALWDRADDLAFVDTTPLDDVQARPYYQAETPPRQRRKLLEWRDKSEAVPAGSEAQKLYRQRLRFLRALAAFPVPEAGPDIEIGLADFHFARLTVTEACTACGACARICPTRALELATGESHFELRFSPELCLACQACAHVCAPEAITIDRAPTFNQIFIDVGDGLLSHGALNHCQVCGVPFAGRYEDKFCPICAFRRQNPFGSYIPPGVATRIQKRPAGGNEEHHDR